MRIPGVGNQGIRPVSSRINKLISGDKNREQSKHGTVLPYHAGHGLKKMNKRSFNETTRPSLVERRLLFDPAAM